MPRYEHSGNAVPTTLATSITNATTSISIAASTGWPTGAVGPFWATIDAGTASEEKILVASRTGTTLTVTTRGADGTTATSHASGASIQHTFSATEADDASSVASAVAAAGGTPLTTSGTQTVTNKTISADSNTLSGLAASSFVLSNASGNVDGAAAAKAVPTGTVVGTTDTQTLTNKTLTSPTLNTPVGVARGTVGYTAATTGIGGIGGTATSVVAVSFTAVTGRRYRVSAHVYLAATADNNSAYVTISEGPRLQADGVALLTAGIGYGCNPVLVVTGLSAGTHVFTVQVTQIAGTGTISANAGADAPMFILVEDIGT